MRIAVLHNRRPEHPSEESLPEDDFEEYDSADTIEAITAALKALGTSPEPVLACRDLPQRLDAGSYDFVFNIAEGSGRRSREAVPAAICELLELPYTGSDPLTLAATLDKTIAKRIVSPDVAVARGTTDAAELGGLSFPVIVKPNDEGSSKGIRISSHCVDVETALAQAGWLARTYGCPVLFEEWLPGAEVTVAIAGNGTSATVLAAMEIGFASPQHDAPFIYSLETKRDYRNKVAYHVPPCLPPPALSRLNEQALRAFHLLGCRDVARMDFRLDAEGEPRFIECNPLPGLNPESSDFVIATRGVLSYDRLVGNILRDAAARYSIRL